MELCPSQYAPLVKLEKSSGTFQPVREKHQTIRSTCRTACRADSWGHAPVPRERFALRNGNGDEKKLRQTSKACPLLERAAKSGA